MEQQFVLDIYHYIPVKNDNKLIAALQLLIAFTRQFFWILSKIRKAEALYCWFSDQHAVLPVLISKITGKPVFTVLGGFDSIHLPDLNYGIFNDPFRRVLGKFVLNNSTILLPVDETLIETNPISSDWPFAHPNGVKHHIPNFKTPFKALATGYDPSFWELGNSNREKRVMTVAVANKMQTVKRKGLDLLIDISHLLPGFSFEVVGVGETMIEHLKEKYDIPKNLQLKSKIPIEELVPLYQESSLYLQLSRAEGLPNALCEAMMCGCVPVGSPVFGIPHGIGDTGFLATKPDPELISELIKEAHEKAPELRTKARQRVIDLFLLEKRKEVLSEIINSYI